MDLVEFVNWRDKIMILVRLFGLCMIALVLVSCAATEPDPVIIRETVIAEIRTTVVVTAEITREIEVTRLVEVPVIQEVTRIVEAVVTATPSPTPTQGPPLMGTDIIALNYVTSQESGGVTIEIARVLIANKSAIEQDFTVTDLYQGKDVVAMLVFIITNDSGATATVYPTQGSVQVNTEQILLFDYSPVSTFGDRLGGEIFPGVTKIGGLWFGITRSQLDEITEMTFRANGPTGPDFRRLGPDYEIVIDLNERVFEPLPEEFR